MVVGDAAGEGAGLNGLPEAVLQLVFLIIHRHDAALGAEEGLMGGAGDDLGALLKGILEVVAGDAQDVGHVVHDGGGDLLLVHIFPDLRHGLLVDHHALAEDDELRLILGDDLLGLLHVDLEDVVLADGEVHHGAALGDRVDGDVVVQGAHGLGGEVAALDDVVIQHVAQALGSVLAIQTVLPVHEGGEGAGVGHLAAGDAGLHLGAVKVLAQLCYRHLLHLVDEAGALVVEDVLVVEGLDLLVLGVAAAGVGGGEHLHGAAGGVLRGDQVHAALLTPKVVLLGAL